MKRIEIDKLKNIIKQLENDIGNIKESYQNSKKRITKELNNQRVLINIEIKRLKNQLHYQPNTLKEFLMQEVENWEEKILPIIDKSLLSISRDKLKPTIVDEESMNFFGISIDFEALEKYPTIDFLRRKLKELKEEKKLAKNRAKEEIEKERFKLEQIIEIRLLELRAVEDKITLKDEEIAKLNNQIKALEENKNSLRDKEVKEIENLKHFLKNKEESLKNGIQKSKLKKEKLKKEIRRIEKDKKYKKMKIKKGFEDEILFLKDKLKDETEGEIKKVRDKIEKLNMQKLSQTIDKRLKNLREEKSLIDKRLEEAILARRFIDEFDEKQKLIQWLPALEKRYKKIDRFLENIDKIITNKINKLHKNIEYYERELKKDKNRENEFQKSIDRLYKLELNLFEVDEKSEDKSLASLIEEYKEKKSLYDKLRVDFKIKLNRLSVLENSTIVNDINLNLDRFDEVDSIRKLEHIKNSLEELKNFETTTYQSQKRIINTKFKNYIKNILDQKIENFDDLEDSFKEQLNRVNRNLKQADFGAIKDIHLSMVHLKSDKNSIASLIIKLREKLNCTNELFDDEGSLFFDKPKSIKRIDDIIGILERIKELSDKGAVHLFDTIDLDISYVENGIKQDNKNHLKNDSSSGGNILLKVAVAISILALFIKKTATTRKETPLFLIIDEVSRLQRQNQEKLKNYINRNGFKSLFITPDPIFPDSLSAIYYMFRGVSRDGKLEISQMNMI